MIIFQMPAEDSPDQVFVHVREMFDQCLPGRPTHIVCTIKDNLDNFAY